MKKLLVLAIPFLLLTACGDKAEEPKQTNVGVIVEDKETTYKTEIPSKAKSINLEVDEKVSFEKDLKIEYIAKLKEMDTTLTKADEILQNGSRADMNEGKIVLFDAWEKELNNIYGLLKERLSSEEMEKLRVEQREWVTTRDNIETKESAEFEGGTLETFQYISKKAKLTKERCFELVEKYFN